MVNRRSLIVVLLPLIAACSTESPARNGTCALSAAVDCSVAVDGGTVAPGWDLLGYACSGSARPDDAPNFIEGVPQGLVCGNRGELAEGGGKAYCCTPTTTPCALNPVASCAPSESGYQCRGSSRPEMLNASVRCHQGVFQGDLLEYCCSSPSTLVEQGCTQSDGLGCSPRLIGWTCPKGSVPTQEEFGANKSKADFYYLLCPIPKPAGNPAYENFCCFTPALVPIGGSCVQDLGVAGCAPGNFGMACYGPDTPAEDYPPLECGTGSPGFSAEGYPATLYCCTFQ